MKYRQMFLMTILAIFGLSVICGCATLFSPEPPSVLNQKDLLNLVMDKKRAEGDHEFVGGTIDEDGKVLLLYPNIVYVQWDESENPEGTVSIYPGQLAGPGGSDIVEQVENGILPPGVLVLDIESSYIDAREYLKN